MLKIREFEFGLYVKFKDIFDIFLVKKFVENRYSKRYWFFLVWLKFKKVLVLRW